MAQREGGSIYRIDLRLEGSDSRIALREKSELSPAEIEALRCKLGRLDASSPFGPWTKRVLESVRTRPKEKAGELALRLDLPKDWLKISVRKLKNLGLTISHKSGYELSPRGMRFLQLLVGCGAPPMRSFEVSSYRDRQLSSKVSWHGRHAMLESDGSSRP